MPPLMLSLLVAVACAVACHLIAKRRGANPVLWGVMGFLFGPLALPFVLFSGRKN